MEKMSDSLDEYKERVDGTLKTYDTMIRNQKRRERKIVKSVKTGLVSVIIAGSLFGGYTGYKYIDTRFTSKYKEKERKIIYYQQKFNKVQSYIKKDWYTLGDKLSEELQKEMKDEGWFSPTNDLYEKVKKYDNKKIDPVMKKIKKRKWDEENGGKWYYKPMKYFRDLWDDIF